MALSNLLIWGLVVLTIRAWETRQAQAVHELAVREIHHRLKNSLQMLKVNCPCLLVRLQPETLRVEKHFRAFYGFSRTWVRQLLDPSAMYRMGTAHE